MEKQYINFINKDLIIIEERGVKDPLEMFNDVPDKDFYSFQLECFKMLLEKKESGNHYNNRALLSAYRVIEYKEVRFDQFVYNGLADGRFSPDRHDLIMKYVSLISVTGFMKFCPVVIDRKGFIIDGYQRLHACRILNVPFWYAMIDGDFGGVTD